MPATTPIDVNASRDIEELEKWMSAWTPVREDVGTRAPV